MNGSLFWFIWKQAIILIGANMLNIGKKICLCQLWIVTAFFFFLPAPCRERVTSKVSREMRYEQIVHWDKFE